jgi:ribose-phosphate pyrophosphokinase
VRGRSVILYDDLISTGTTLRRAATKCRDAGARHIFAAATHGLFIGDAPHVLAEARFEGVIVSDTVRSKIEEAGCWPKGVTILDTSALVSEAISLAHSGI